MSANRTDVLDGVGRVSFLVYVTKIINDQSLHCGGLHVRHQTDGKLTNNSTRNHRLAASTVKSTLDA